MSFYTVIQFRPKFKLLGHDNKQPLNPQLFFFSFLRYGMGGGGHEHEALKVLSSGAGAPGCASRGGIPPARPMLLSTDAEYRSGKEGGWGKCGAFEIKRRRDKKTKKKSVGSRFASIRSLARAAQYQYTVALYYVVHSNEYPNLCMRQLAKKSSRSLFRGDKN